MRKKICIWIMAILLSCILSSCGGLGETRSQSQPIIEESNALDESVDRFH